EAPTGLFLGVHVRARHGADGEQAAPMVEEIASDTGVEIAELVGAMAYGDGDTRSAVEATGARMVAKVPPVVNAGLFPKTNFVIDPEAPSATCPAGHTSTDAHAVRDHKGRPTQRLYFSIEVCGGCPLRPQCVKGEGARSITLSVHEARMAKARADELKPSVKAKLCTAAPWSSERSSISRTS